MRLALTETLARRRSVRSYTGDGLNMSYLSAILAAAAGVTGTPSVQLQGSRRLALKFRSVASAGGLFPVDLIFVALSIKGLNRGIYQYRTNGHALELIANDSAVDRLLNCFAVPEEAISIRRSCGIVLPIGQPWRVMRKYGARGMRFVFMEAGAIAQNVALACTALGYGSVDCASVYDDEVHEVLGIDGHDVALLHAIVVGCPG
jgi:SagB-type dehydrogenase family enzyme